MNRNERWDHSFQNSISVPFNYSNDTLQAPKPQLLKPQTSLSRCYLYMPCKRNFAGAVWKTCRHGSPQHQFMPPPYGAHKIHQVTKSVGEISDAKEWLTVQVQGWGVDAERMHNTSTKFTWWVDQSSTWRHFGPCTLQSSASGDDNSSVTSEEYVLEKRKRFQRWCLILQVSFMLPDAGECTNTHHARFKNSKSLLLQFLADQFSTLRQLCVLEGSPQRIE